MDATDSAATEPAPGGEGTERSLLELAQHTATYARAWSHLVASEAALAKANLLHVALGALLVPAFAFGIVVAVDAALAALLFELLRNWLLAIGAVALLNIAAMLVLLWLLRAWWRTLSLPHSRDALTRLWRNHGDVLATEQKGAPAGGAV